MTWKIPKIWENGDVWILGGGPSITKQFEIPDNIVKRVIEGGATPDIYSNYMKSIHDKHIIGINVAYKIGNWIDVIFFGDSSFFVNHKKELSVFPGMKVSCDPKVGKYDWVKFVERDTSHINGISPHQGMVSWNGNSGASAISLAVHMGAKRVLLLGFDMKLDEGMNQHWHDLYGRRSQILNPNSKKIRKLPFDRHLIGFSQIASDAKKMGVEILNVSPDSAISYFKKVQLKEVL